MVEHGQPGADAAVPLPSTVTRTPVRARPSRSIAAIATESIPNRPAALDRARRASAGARRSARSRGRSARCSRSSRRRRRRGSRSAWPSRRGCPGSSMRSPYSRAGPLTIARCGSQRMIRAPMLTSLSTKKRRFSNIFSKIRIVPAPVSPRRARSRSGRPGTRPRPVLDLRDLVAEVVLDRELLAGERGRSFLELDATPSRAKSGGWRQDRRDRRPRSRCRPGDRAKADEARDLDVLGRDPHSGRRGAHAPDRSTFDSIPSICAPSETRNRQRSWTCGSRPRCRSPSRPRAYRGHDGVLGAGHARLVEKHVLAAESPPRR